MRRGREPSGPPSVGLTLREMFLSFREGPATVRYPGEETPPPAGWRGRVHVVPEVCVGCSVCAIVCPSECIEMVPDSRQVEARGRAILRKRLPQVQLYACIRCGLCEDHCPTDPKSILLKVERTGADTRKGEVI